MNRGETWELFLKGRDAWNAWAKEMLAKRRVLEEAGEWQVDRLSAGANEVTTNWLEDAKADFQGQEFTEEEFSEGFDFRGFIFPGTAGFHEASFGGVARFGEANFGWHAWFAGASFGGDAHFDGASFGGFAGFWGASFGGVAGFGKANFGGVAGFRKASFGGEAGFDGASFGGDALFGEASFGGDARFDGASFGRVAWFFQATFKSYTTFAKALFEGPSTFGAIKVERAFTLVGARFFEVPDFIQANFAQAPRLDELAIPPRGLWLRLRTVKSLFQADPDREAQWRALKRLAIQAHDHAREQEFFAEELKARRNAGSLRDASILLASLFYQGLANFGRSLALPLVWLGLVLVVFGGIYLSDHRAYVIDKTVPTYSCIVGSEDSNAVRAAVALSWRNTIPFTGLGAPEKLNQVYRCLYGVESSAASPGFPESRLPPRIPDLIAFYSVLQTVISAVLIFLFLLAVRNHFRIK